MTNTFSFYIFVLVSVLFVSCSQNDLSILIDERESITSMKLVFQESANTLPLTFLYSKDTDGTGPKVEKKDTIRLDSAKTYNLKVVLMDETKSPAVDVTKEIEREKEIHFTQISPSTTGFIKVSPLDLDANGFPVGLNNSFEVLKKGNTKLSIVLYHQLGSKDNAENNGADIAVDFDLKTK
ncbi:MAG: hypothetical protein KA313_03900 [Pseudarcicella sp.]|nr:hypothetical protein [Pseudarcicella sp.]MBP6410219.1 hypothetical protein [Pseudarcicella sp.]